MSAAPATAGRNLVGVAGVGALMVGGYFLLSTGGGNGWTWFAHHPGALGALVIAVCVAVVVTLASGRVGVALAAALILGIGAYAVPDVRTTLGHTERPFLGSAQHGGGG